MHIESVSTRGQRTLTLIGIRVHLALREKVWLLYYEPLLRTVPSLVSHTKCVGRFSRTMSNSNWCNTTFYESFASHSKSVVLIVIFTLENYILSNLSKLHKCLLTFNLKNSNVSVFYLIATNAVQRRKANWKFRFIEFKKFWMLHVINFRIFKIIINAPYVTDCLDNFLNSTTKHNEEELK